LSGYGSRGYGQGYGNLSGSTGRPEMRSRRGPRGYQRSDERLREEIIDRLLQQEDINLEDIQVDVNDGIVTLSGTVDNRRTKHQIEDIIDGIWGVKDIANNLHLQGGSESVQSGRSDRSGREAPGYSGSPGGSMGSSTYESSGSQSGRTGSNKPR